ncbi:phosphate ABC transporter, inner membrane subunit PstC [Ruminiclostridium papyrosolvens DSM 2782]|uniref:Phosphate transport system permease protein n=1 Tax=Ruminiclostridium papyrosolvens DSM 2782 TaxID=588581 RepID=F1TDB5_9FIRM|nr:phosphate ABC transporter permease subunit PstC [Ruminiclostridium papyrosolvens]EGD47553.1 phosphate ABC transporter, inner membrane subunit PstC [Ruminiclostridium papyrosolvens DSM 2782]WES36501.1 phosphate ABC transporter permease subunit PstC [Ruminiclostridium papyrosolvens DSM 2782]
MLKEKYKNSKLYYLEHELLGKYTVTFFGIFLIILTICLVTFIATKGLATFFNNHYSPIEFLFSTVWKPDRGVSKGGPAIGTLIFIVGSVSVSLLALIISTPLSVSIAIFMTEISPKLGKKLLQPAIEVFTGIPSVVYGWVGLSVLVPLIRANFGGLGFSLLAGSLVLSIMIFPTIASVSADAIRAISRDYYEASLSIGATRWQTIWKIILPSAMPGILTGVVLGLARAFGEALAVQMVLGNTIRIPHSIVDSTVNMTSIITMDMGNTAMGTVWNNALWSMALLLLIMSFLFIILIHKIGKKGVSK